MEPTSIARAVVYKPLIPTSGGRLPKNDDNFYDHWHVEMEVYDEYGWIQSLRGPFKTEEEARGYMMGWNAHRDAVSESLLRSKFSRK